MVGCARDTITWRDRPARYLKGISKLCFRLPCRRRSDRTLKACVVVGGSSNARDCLFSCLMTLAFGPAGPNFLVRWRLSQGVCVAMLSRPPPQAWNVPIKAAPPRPAQ